MFDICRAASAKNLLVYEEPERLNLHTRSCYNHVNSNPCIDLTTKTYNSSNTLTTTYISNGEYTPLE